jgi:hypothetical protein
MLFIALLFVHRTLPPFVIDPITFTGALALIITPIFVALRIILAGIWIATGSGELLDECTHRSTVSVFAIAMGIAVSLKPMIATRGQPSP